MDRAGCEQRYAQQVIRAVETHRPSGFSANALVNLRGIRLGFRFWKVV